MSADNWGVCPKCGENNLPEYGKVSEAEYKLALKKQECQEKTLREYYEIGTDKNGVFSVGYYCSCEKCGFEFEFKFEKNVNEAAK